MSKNNDELFATGGGLDVLGELTQSEHQSRLGQQLGSYILTEHLGSGGMGSVYRARSADGRLDRDVAIKLLHGAVSEKDQSRFRREAEIHSRLAHPNIARLFDAELNDSVSCLVMELVDGQPIDQYCQKNELSLEQRLSLLVQVGRAVSFAHSNLIIHRDIKPSNVLVGNDGVPKLLDFGIAKLLDDGDAELTADARILTPTYASPEQILGEQITTSSDVFQLGVLLVNVLTGASPFRDSSLKAALARAVNEELSATDHEGLAELPVELRAVARKCLQTESSRRYASAAAFCDDLERYLGNYPVLARNPTWIDKTAKFVSRNPWQTAVVAGLLVTIVVGNLIYLERLEANREVAEAEAEKATAVTEFLIDLFDRASPDAQAGEELTVRGLLDESGELVAEKLSGQPEVLADIRHALGRIYLSLEEFERSESLLTSALEARQQMFGEKSAETSTSHAYLGRLALEQVGNNQKAENHFRQALAVVPTPGSKNASRAILLTDYARFLIVVKQDFTAAIERLHEGLAIQNDLLPPVHKDRISLLRQLMIAHERLADFSTAQEIGEQTVDLAQALYGPVHAQLIDPLYSLGRVHESQGRYAEADRHFYRALTISRSIYGDMSSRTGNVALNLAHTRRLTGRLEDAAEFAGLAISSMRSVYGEDGTDYAVALAVGGTVQRELGAYSIAEPWLTTALKLYTKEFGSSHTHTAYGAMMLAHLYREDGRWEEARKLYWQAHNNWLAALGEDHPDPAKVKLYLADIYTRTGEFQFARELLTAAQTVNGKWLPEDHDRIAEGNLLESALWRAEGKFAECMAPVKRGIRQRELALPDDHQSLAFARIELGHCFLANDQSVEAREAYRMALAVLKDHPAFDAREVRQWLAQGTSQPGKFP